mgnify:CR=1 FL=1
MQMKVAKWGNSIGIRIPQKVAEQAKIKDGSIVEIEIDNETIKIKKRELSLEKLLDAITSENLHKEISTGSPVGGEIW